MRQPSKIFNTNEFRALKKYWDNRLKEVGFKDIEREDGSLINQDNWIFMGKRNDLLDSLALQFQWVSENQNAYNNVCKTIYERQNFAEDWHKEVFRLRIEGLTERAIGKKLKKAQSYICDVLNRYLFPQISENSYQVVIKRILDNETYDCERDKRILSNVMAGRNVSKIAKEEGLLMKSLSDIISSYIYGTKVLSNRTKARLILKRGGTGSTVKDALLQSYAYGLTVSQISKEVGSWRQKISSMIKEAIEEFTKES